MQASGSIVSEDSLEIGGAVLERCSMCQYLLASGQRNRPLAYKVLLREDLESFPTCNCERDMGWFWDVFSCFLSLRTKLAAWQPMACRSQVCSRSWDNRTPLWDISTSWLSWCCPFLWTQSRRGYSVEHTSKHSCRIRPKYASSDSVMFLLQQLLFRGRINHAAMYSYVAYSHAFMTY